MARVSAAAVFGAGRRIRVQGLDLSQLATMASMYAMASNIFFALRGILSKKVRRREGARVRARVCLPRLFAAGPPGWLC